MNVKRLTLKPLPKLLPKILPLGQTSFVKDSKYCENVTLELFNKQVLMQTSFILYLNLTR